MSACGTPSYSPRVRRFPDIETRPCLCLLLCEFSRKKENLSPTRYNAPLFILPILHGIQRSDVPLRGQASRLNDLLFEVTAVATPPVAYAFVTKRLSALHTYNRAGW